jgi:hypothetical protein
VGGRGVPDEQVAELDFLVPDRGVEPPGRGDGEGEVRVIASGVAVFVRAYQPA